MDKLKFTIPIIFVLMYFLFTLTSCEEDSLLEEQQVIAQEAVAPFGVDPNSSQGSTTSNSRNNANIDIMYVQWQPWVLDARKAEIRAKYSGPRGKVYLLGYTVCQLDSTIEKWEIIWNPSYSPKDRTPDPLIILSDHEGEMENDRAIDFAHYCP